MRKSLEKTVDALLVGTYAVLHVALAFFHEPWQDEAQAWLIARDVPLHDFLRIMSYEGTPGLWHALLMPFARLGMPYWTATALNLGLAIGAVAVFVRYAPFSRFFKALVLFSGLLGFEYVMYARSYALGALFLFLVAAWYGRRFTKPIAYAAFVAILANTNVFMLLIAAPIGLAYAVECLRQRYKGWLLPVSIMLGGGLLALAQMWPRPGAALSKVAFVQLGHAASAINMALFPWMDGIPQGWLTVASLAVVLTALWAIRRDRMVFMIALIGGLAISSVFVLMHVPEIRRAGNLVLLLLFALWVSDRPQDAAAGGRASRLALRLTACALAVTILPVMFVRIPEEVRYLSSGARDLAAYVASAVPADAVIAAHPPMAVGSTLPYLPGRRYWRVYERTFATYTKWDEFFLTHKPFGSDPNEIVNLVAEDFPATSRPYLLLDQELRSPEARGYVLKYRTREQIVGRGQREVYFLYAPMPVAQRP